MSVRMQAIKAHMDVRKGQEFTAPSEHRANELEARGLAQRVGTVTTRAGARAKANAAAAAGPLPSAGGRAGKRKRSS